MTTTGVLLIALVGLAAALCWATAIQMRSRRSIVAGSRLRPEIDAATRALVESLVADDAPSGTRQRLTRLPVDRRVRLISRIAAGIEGRELARLRPIALDAGVVWPARLAISDRRWWVRLRGVGLLSALALDDASRADLLADAHPAVRAAAVVWTERTGLDAAGVRILVPLLDDPDGVVRELTRDVLAGSEASAEPLLDEVDDPSAVRSLVSALGVAAELHDPVLDRAAAPWTTADDPAVRAAAVDVVADDADPVRLATLLKDTDPIVRRAAVRAAGRSRQRSLAGPVGRCLRDEDWRVRDAAIHALRALGPAGEVIIRTEARSMERAA